MEAACSSLHDLVTLARFEEQLEAHIEGLRVADEESRPHPVADGGGAGQEASWRRAAQWQTADEAFVCARLALEAAAVSRRGGPPCGDRLAALLELAGRPFALGPHGPHRPACDVARGIASAAAWLPWPQVEDAVRAWAASDEPVRRYCALMAATLQRMPAGTALAEWLDDGQALVRERALRACGELGATALAGALREAVAAVPAEGAGGLHCRDEAAASLCLLGDPDDAQRLSDWVGDLLARGAWPSCSGRWLAAWAQAATPEPLQVFIRTAGQDPARWRLALTVIRYSGDAAWLPVLLQVMEHQCQPDRLARFHAEPRANVARQAADVFAHVTGLRIGDGRWQAGPQEPGDADDVTTDPCIPAALKQDPDDGLLWPDVPALKRWWSEHAPRFRPGRYLAGLPLTAASATQVLMQPQATQLQRHHAALFLRVAGRTPQLFDVRAPLWRQRAQAAQWGMGSA